MMASRLHADMVAAGLSIHGVTVGDLDDKGTWLVDFTGEPSEADKATVETVIENFVVTEEDRKQARPPGVPS